MHISAAGTVSSSNLAPPVRMQTLWRHQMETFSALLALCAGNSPATGEFPSQSPVTRSFDVFFALCLNKRSSKQSLGWWFETPSRSSWRHCNGHRDDQLCVPCSMSHAICTRFCCAFFCLCYRSSRIHAIYWAILFRIASGHMTAYGYPIVNEVNLKDMDKNIYWLSTTKHNGARIVCIGSS